MSSTSSSDDSDDSDAERRRRVASCVTGAPVMVQPKPLDRAGPRAGHRPRDDSGGAGSGPFLGDRDAALHKQAAVLLHRYLDQHLDTSEPVHTAHVTGHQEEGDGDDGGCDFRVFRNARGPVVSGRGLLAEPFDVRAAGRLSRSEARRRARPRRRGASDSDDEDKARRALTGCGGLLLCESLV